MTLLSCSVEDSSETANILFGLDISILQTIFANDCLVEEKPGGNMDEVKARGIDSAAIDIGMWRCLHKC